MNIFIVIPWIDRCFALALPAIGRRKGLSLTLCHVLGEYGLG